MTGKDKHMPLYSSSDIEKYLGGELSDPEMHAMERAALDDPFLADALEGMVIHRSLPGQPSFQQDMASLQKRLDDRVTRNKGKVRLLPLAMRYAAAVVLLLGLGVTAWYALFSKKMENATLATSKVAVPAAPPHTPDSTTLGPMDNKPTASTGRSTLHDNTPTTTRPDTQPKTAAPIKSFYTPPPANASSSNQDLAYRNDASIVSKQPASPYANNAFNNLSNNKPMGANELNMRMPDTLVLHKDTANNRFNAYANVEARQQALSFKKTTDQLVFTGKVINPQNIPLAGATLSVKRGRDMVNTVTDANGNFTLTLPKNDTPSRIVVNYIGYEQGYVTLNTDDKTGNIVQLKPQSLSLNEVVVVGYGSKRKELTRTDINSAPPDLSQTAVPADGWPSYTRYLESNKNSPQIDTTIRGYEAISFIVNKKGEFSSFRVERSLSPAHDALAIRLVKEGPPWKLLKGKKERARVILTW